MTPYIFIGSVLLNVFLLGVLMSSLWWRQQMNNIHDGPHQDLETEDLEPILK